LEALKHGTRLAFVGKPCDVAALRQYLRLRPELAPQLPILISFMCAGVPSINGTHEVLQAMGADRSRLASFRYRGDGWPGMAKAVLIDGQSFEMDYNTSWGTILGRHLQFRCKICPDGTGEFADVVCADAWYGTDGYPDFTEQAGRSVVLSRTQQGEALIKAAMQDGFLKTATLQLSELQAMQPYQVTRKRMVLGRTLAARLAIGSAPKYRGLRLLRAALGGSLLAMLKQSWGTYKRAAPERQ
jgi:coenzyme F420 hydrogenase subunit beta